MRGVERVERVECGAWGGAPWGGAPWGEGGGLGEVVVVFLDGVLDAEENGGAPVGEL